MWRQDANNINQNATVCVHQKVGYTFSLAQSLPSNAAQLLPADYGTVRTRNTQVPLIIAIVFIGISMIALLYDMIALHATIIPPLRVLRIGYLASIPGVILLTVSSAKITATADKMVGVKDLGGGVTVDAWMGWRFYASTWIATGFMWLAIGLSIAAAFRIAAAIRVNEVQNQTNTADARRLAPLGEEED
jgi:SUR7/PalI family